MISSYPLHKVKSGGEIWLTNFTDDKALVVYNWFIVVYSEKACMSPAHIQTIYKIQKACPPG